MSINIKNALLAQAQLREMYASRDSGPAEPGRDAVQQAGTSGQPDRVTLSATALQLARMAEIRTGEPLVNIHRVVEIRQALIEGSYRIDPLQIAEKVRQIDFRMH